MLPFVAPNSIVLSARGLPLEVRVAVRIIFSPGFIVKLEGDNSKAVVSLI